jgi:PleD family two-component response regulator
MTQAVLLLDDDARFRTFLSRLLQARGYVTVEAETVSQALAAASHYQFSLAIVDFNLPDANGISFITSYREMGNRAPVVFLTASQLDHQTFTYLRNILRVSLVLQKPIQPELFFQQLEGLLPPPTPQQKQTSPAMPSQSPESHQVSRFNAEYVPGNTADPQRANQSREMRAKSEVEAQIRHAQIDLAVNLPQQWQELSIRLRELQHDMHDVETRYALFTLTRELRHDAASLGLAKVSEAAGKIEGYSKLLDPGDPSGNDVLWLEMFRSLAVGETALYSVTNSASEAASQRPVHAGKVMLVGGADTLDEPSGDIQPRIDATIVFMNDIAQSALKAAEGRLDAAILDAATFGKKNIFALASEIRSTKHNASLPLAFIVSATDSLTDAERVYHGCSEVLRAPVGQRQFEDTLLRLATVNQSSHARILAVDDDCVLTTLIEKTLGAAGMSVTSLNQPINILDTLDMVHPDLILLDVVMPGLSGYDICRMLRASEKWRDMPIIVLTSKSDAQGRAAAFQAGANDFLAKPILSEELLLRVRMQLQRTRSRCEEGASDKLTGILSETAFMRRAQDAFIDAGRSSEELSLCVIDINAFEEHQEHGIFASFNLITAMGQLIKSHFAAEVLRGRRGESGFMLIFRKEDHRVVEKAIGMLLNDFAQLKFTNDSGRRFSAQAKAGIASYPRHGTSLGALVHVAKGQLAQAQAFRQSNHDINARPSR